MDNKSLVLTDWFISNVRYLVKFLHVIGPSRWLPFPMRWIASFIIHLDHMQNIDCVHMQNIDEKNVCNDIKFVICAVGPSFSSSTPWSRKRNSQFITSLQGTLVITWVISPRGISDTFPDWSWVKLQSIQFEDDRHDDSSFLEGPHCVPHDLYQQIHDISLSPST